MVKKKQLWERQEWDSRASFQYFHTYYLSQIAPRSLDKAYRNYREDKGEKPGSKKDATPAWRNWFQAKNYSGKKIKNAVGWTGRAEAFDDWCAENNIDQWIERREAVRQDDWQLGEDMRKLASAILEEGPSYLKQRRRLVKGTPAKDGKPETPDRVIITLALDVNAAVKAGKLGSDLQRLAAEMATDRIEGEFDVREHVVIIIPDNKRGDRGEDE